MMIERIPITDRASWLKLRERDVTASVAGALLGVHEYQSAYGLWALKTGRIQEDADETPAMVRGRLLEPVALQLLREKRPDWTVTAGQHYFRDPMDRLGATPDAFATDPERGPGIVQVKTVEAGVFRRKWRNEDGEVELPLWIACQAIIEAHLTGSQWACVAAMVVSHGIDLEVIEVPIHAGVIERIRQAVHEFWGLIESGRAPDPDWNRDAALAARFATLNDNAIDLSTDNMLPGLLDERATLKARIKTDEERVAEIDGEIRAKVGAHTAATLPGWRISLKTVETKPYSVKGRITRPLRVTPVVQKEAVA